MDVYIYCLDDFAIVILLITLISLYFYPLIIPAEALW